MDSKLLIYESKREMIRKRGRLDFSKFILPTPGYARCHSFSQDYFTNALAAVLNYGVDCVFLCNDDVYRLLELLGEAIFPDAIPRTSVNYQVGVMQKRAYLERIKKVCVIQNVNNMLDFGNMLMSLLNDSVRNLRIGNQRWNASISYSFDPVCWESVQNGKVISNASLDPEPERYRRKNGIYLTNPGDWLRFVADANFRNALQEATVFFDYPFGIDIYTCNIGNESFLIVGSSGNEYSKEDWMEPYTDEVCIYISDHGRWIPIHQLLQS